MITVNTHEAKTKLSALLSAVEEKGEVVVSIKEEKTTKEEVYFHFTVRDSGAGIPKAKQRLIFDAFAQADSSITRKHGGTGLGLAITSQLVELMGGKIWVESKGLNRGTSFYFTLPMENLLETHHDF